jgi:hypothetical protein
MLNNKHPRPRQRSHYRTIDDFSSPRSIDEPHKDFRQTPASPASIHGMPAAELSRHSFRAGSKPAPSLLNTTIAGGLSQPDRPAPKAKKTRSWNKYLKRTGLVILLVVLLSGGWVSFKFFRDVARLTHNDNPFAAVSSLFHQVTLKSQGNWVNILVCGYDPSDGDITTDTIIVVSVNKQTNQAILLSVPRDMWVNNIPGYGHQ